ncbi:hypothetical protein QTG56_00970 [Rossellomorea sp. AcN35-11]|nr:hypothetical protein [Rossellomorea aquimaris]WJV29774.1 hypothetical protein QTG56_00970 [Rossellomorea sp. AcN35-11]
MKNIHIGFGFVALLSGIFLSITLTHKPHVKVAVLDSGMDHTHDVFDGISIISKDFSSVHWNWIYQIKWRLI